MQKNATTLKCNHALVGSSFWKLHQVLFTYNLFPVWLLRRFQKGLLSLSSGIGCVVCCREQRIRCVTYHCYWRSLAHYHESSLLSFAFTVKVSVHWLYCTPSLQRSALVYSFQNLFCFTAGNEIKTKRPYKGLYKSIQWQCQWILLYRPLYSCFVFISLADRAEGAGVVDNKCTVSAVGSSLFTQH